MTKPPRWFTAVAVAALLWNLAGLLAIFGDLSLSSAQLASLPPEQQALHAARPLWSVAGSVLAVAAGTLGCILLLLRKRWAVWAFVASLVGIVLQDIGLFIVAAAVQSPGTVAAVMQGLVLLIAVGLLALARKATAQAWLA